MVRGTRYLGGSEAMAAKTASANSRFWATSGGPGLKSGISRWSRSMRPSSWWNSPGRNDLSQFMVTPKATLRSQAAKREGSRSWSRFV